MNFKNSDQQSVNCGRCSRQGSEKSTFWLFSGGLRFSQVRLFYRNSNTRPLDIIESPIPTNAPCKITCLYNAPSLHVVAQILKIAIHTPSHSVFLVDGLPPKWGSQQQQQQQQQQPAPSPTGSYVPPPTGSCQATICNSCYEEICSCLPKIFGCCSDDDLPDIAAFWAQSWRVQKRCNCLETWANLSYRQKLVGKGFSW